MKKNRAIVLLAAAWGGLLMTPTANATAPSCTSGPCAWPVSPSNTLLFTKDSGADFEPSGLSWAGGYLYIVSDNGKIARVSLGANNNTGKVLDYQDMNKVDSLVDTDFEGMTSVGGALFLSVEGDASSIMPTIYEYYPNPDPQMSNRLPAGSENNLGRSWQLTDLPHNGKREEGGMEGMTFVPDGKHPFPDSTGGFNGLFLAATQAEKGKGKIYAYDLEQNGTGVMHAGIITESVLKTAAISALFYSSTYDTLFVLYDEGYDRKDNNGAFLLQEIRMTPPSGTSSQGMVSQIFLTQPLSPAGTVLQGIEGVALSGRDLFIAIDQKKFEARHNGTCTNDSCSRFTNIVYRYRQYPQH